MRKLCSLIGAGLLGAGLLGAAAGCCGICQHVAGVCDCDPPPVASLLVGPSGGHSSLGLYADVPYAPTVTGPAGPIAPIAPVAPIALPQPEAVPVVPRSDKGKAGN